MSQVEMIRPEALGVAKADVRRFEDEVADLVAAGSSQAIKTRLAELIAAQPGATTFGDTGIELYAEALADYASPNRAELIGSLCRRALETPAVARQAVTVQPRVTGRVGTPAQSAVVRRRRWWVWIAAGIGVGLAGIAGAWMGHASRSSAAAPGGSPVPGVESDIMTDVMTDVEAVPAGPDAWALGTILALEADLVVAPRPPAGMSGRKGVERAQGQEPLARLASPPSPPASDVTSRSAGMAAVEALPVPLLTMERSVSEPPAHSVEGRDTPGPSFARSGRVYTSADADVEPPVLVSGQPRPLPPALPDSPARGTIDLLIDEQGVVRTATVVGRPQRWDEMMMLSSLKNLRYRPAVRDGSPVPYRLRIQP
jgi:hypothetical protein